MEKNFKERLQEVIGGQDITPLAKKCGISEGAIRSYLRGGQPGLDKVLKISEGLNISAAWLVAGQGPKELGKVEASIEPGGEVKKAKLLEAGRKATARNVHLRQVVEWMDEQFGADEDQAFLFYEDMRRRYKSFDKFIGRQVEKKRPGECDLDAPIPSAGQPGSAGAGGKISGGQK